MNRKELGSFILILAVLFAVLLFLKAGPSPEAMPTPQLTLEEANQELVDHIRSITYEVQWGDTLASIARRHRVSLGELIRWNNIENPDLIQVGQILRVR